MVVDNSSVIRDNLSMGKKRKRRRPLVSDQIRTAIEASGLSRYRIALETGIDDSALARFMSGERGLSSKALDTLGRFLDFELVMHGPKRS